MLIFALPQSVSSDHNKLMEYSDEQVLELIQKLEDYTILHEMLEQYMRKGFAGFALERYRRGRLKGPLHIPACVKESDRRIEWVNNKWKLVRGIENHLLSDQTTCSGSSHFEQGKNSMFTYESAFAGT